MAKFLAYLALLGTLAVGAAWYVVSTREPETTRDSAALDDEWLEDLYSQNPKEAQQAERDVNTLGERALPVVRATLRAEGSDRERGDERVAMPLVAVHALEQRHDHLGAHVVAARQA